MMIRIMTGENWPKLMEALSKPLSPGFDCIVNPTYQDYAKNGCKSIFLSIHLHFRQNYWLRRLSIGYFIFLQLCDSDINDFHEAFHCHNHLDIPGDLRER
jgi:hypothetical protein